MKPYNQWFYCNMDELIEINKNVEYMAILIYYLMLL